MPWRRVTSGLSWVLATASPNYRNIVHLSLIGPYSAAMNDGITALTSAGIVVVAAAGNVYDDACYYSPSSGACSTVPP